MSKSNALRFLVGTYAQGEGQGIYQVVFDPDSHSFSSGKVSSQPRPSWMVSQGPYLFASSEIPPNSQDVGKIHVYHMNPSELTPLHVANDLPHILVHLCLLPEENRLFSVSYGTGHVLSFQIGADGSLALTDSLKHTGSSVHPIRQTCAHPHSIWLSPDRKYLCMCDLGTDEILIYRTEQGRLIPCPEKCVPVPAGYGARHLAFSRDGTKAYLITELEYRVLVFDYDGDGNFTLLQDLALCPGLPAEEHSGGAIRLYGNMLYCTNRGASENRIDWLRIGDDGIPVPAGHISTGACPRDIVLTPAGRYLLCANQKADSVTLYERTESTGALTHLATLSGIPSPCCILTLS